MVNGRDNNSSRDTRGLFERFLSPLWRGITKASDTHNGVIGSISNQLKITLKDIVDSKKDSWLDTAEGDMLDFWANTVGITRREDEDDETFRARVKKYIIVLRSTIPAIEDALRDYFGNDGTNVSIYEPHTNIFYLNRSLLNGVDYLQGEYYRYAVIDISIGGNFDYDEVMAIVDKFKPAGVMVYITHDTSLSNDAKVLTGLYDDMDVRHLSREFTRFTGYSAGRMNALTLSTSSVMNPDANLFILNKSNLNSLDVLAGSAIHGKTSLHGAFTAEDFTPRNDESVVEMIARGEECDPMMYTATTFAGGAKPTVDLSPTTYMYQAMDLFDYYVLTNNEQYAYKELKYIKVTVEGSPRGMDIGYLTAKDKSGIDRGQGAKWSVAVEGEKPFRVYDNGVNIVNPFDRVSYATLVLAESTQLSTVQLDNSYDGEVIGGIYVSEDGEEYHNVYYGALTNGEYVLRDTTNPMKAQPRYSGSDDTGVIDNLNLMASRALNSSNSYGSFLSGIMSMLTYILYCEPQYSTSTMRAEIMNFRTNQWELVDKGSGRVVRFDKFVATLIDDYISDNGTLVTRLCSDREQEVAIDFYALAIKYSEGFRYHINLGMDIGLDKTTALFEDSSASMAQPQIYNEGEIFKDGRYSTPFKRAVITIKGSAVDPNTDRYFRTSPTQGVTGTNEKAGFNVGLLSAENDAPAVDEGITALISYNNREMSSVKLRISGTTAVLDFNGWDLHVTGIRFVANGYVMERFRFLNKHTTEKIYEPPAPTISYEERDFFRNYYSLSKNYESGKSEMDDYVNKPDLFVTQGTEVEAVNGLASTENYAVVADKAFHNKQGFTGDYTGRVLMSVEQAREYFSEYVDRGYNMVWVRYSFMVVGEPADWYVGDDLGSIRHVADDGRTTMSSTQRIIDGSGRPDYPSDVIRENGIVGIKLFYEGYLDFSINPDVVYEEGDGIIVELYNMPTDGSYSYVLDDFEIIE